MDACEATIDLSKLRNELVTLRALARGYLGSELNQGKEVKERQRSEEISPPPPRELPAILHLSDLQFGRAYLRPRQLAESISSAVKEKPNVIMISGDLSQSGRPEEYRAVRDFLVCLCKSFGIPEKERRRVVFCPGNHDVCWPLGIGAYFTETGIPRAEPLRDDELFRFRMGPYFDFSSSFQDDAGASIVGDESFLFSIHDLTAVGILAISINSSAHEDHSRKIGQIDDNCIERIARRLESFDTRKDILRVVVMHHPLQIGAGSGIDPREGDLLDHSAAAARILWRLGVRMVFTGHIHASSLEHIYIEAGTRKTGGGLLNFLAGSAGVPEPDRPSAEGAGHFANEFNLVRAVAWPDVWELEVYYYDAVSRAFLPKPKFAGPSAKRRINLLTAAM